MYVSLCACLITIATRIPNHRMEHCMETESPSCLKPFPQRSQEFNLTLQYVTWASSSCLSMNKLWHILYGNRRNLGYKYFFWNCDRGFLSKNKIEDVKQVVSRHKPHFLGISEVDLTRNESISHDNESNNEFTTEQAHERLKIEGYRIFLPTSWIDHNKARLIVYVNEEINAKLLDNPGPSSHIQNILLEVGFRRGKKHFVSFYHREWKSCVY